MIVYPNCTKDVCKYLSSSGVVCQIGEQGIDCPKPLVVAIYRDGGGIDKDGKDKGKEQRYYNLLDNLYDSLILITGRPIIIICCHSDNKPKGWIQFMVDDTIFRKNIPEKDETHGWFVHETLLNSMDTLPFRLGVMPIEVKHSMTYEEYRNTKQWKKFCLFVFAHYGKRCVICGTRGNDDNVLQIHHSSYKYLMGEFDNEELPKREAISEVVPVCNNCHTVCSNVFPENPRRVKC